MSQIAPESPHPDTDAVVGDVTGRQGGGFTWDPAQYEGFAEHRARPFHDLVGRVRAEAPRVVVDLGCGPGTLTRTLAERWPDAEVIGLDDSPAMLERAREQAARTGAPANLRFEAVDASQWRPSGATDVVVSNAMLQWIPTHRRLIRRWLGDLTPGAWFAAQIPRPYEQPSHAAIVALAEDPAFSEPLHGVATTRTVAPPEEYTRLFLEAGWSPVVWETEYQQVLTGEDPVFRWTSGAALRPSLQALARWDAEEGAAEGAGLLEAFVDRYRAAMREAYPPVPGVTADDGGPVTIFPARRLFMAGQKPA
ncbi:methyltransferase domain-containing protein [Micrococcus luteus]|uniref:Methyltransferase domain-containing protein n=1 Tax=Micrococcus yunnanensis TaxID=566027 RepID=A0AAP5T9K7_9MICC|nr:MULTISPECIES: methyltransferase domain-containing protein [Micrococcus]OFT09762.1 trans-aconitate methyltransferase [Micrococcus sp. HMSC30C05]OOL30870.1 trans-aconitate methyltransferase [Rhodococcus rhodochrous]TFI19369.1 methyltransferase domain-containing protein [Thiopseudomonas sp. 4R-3cl]CVM36105.1 type 11 methyltransferase [Streptococcus pneumoniae]AWD24096.1 methyltransferase domain-containing protein [Micrococcus luteus]